MQWEMCIPSRNARPLTRLINLLILCVRDNLKLKFKLFAQSGIKNVPRVCENDEVDLR